MLVKALMLPRSELIVANPNENLKSALKKIDDNSFLSIPVAEGRAFWGVISKEKMFEAYFKGDFSDKEDFLENTTVKSIYKNIIPRVDQNDPVEMASRVFETFGVPFVAVVNGRQEFEGIVTHYAIFHQFGEIFGINEGRRISIIAHDIPGQLLKLTEVITKAGGDIISFVVINPRTKQDVREIVARVIVINFSKLVENIKEAGFIVQ